MANDPVLASRALANPVRSVQWGAVILGALGASAISMVLLTFGAGIGLSAASAQPYAGASAKALAVISAFYTAVVMVASFAAGGYIAGRMRMPMAEELAESDFRDGAHGFAVWALSIVIGAVVAAAGIGSALKATAQTAAVGIGSTLAASSNPPQGTSSSSLPREGIATSPTDYAIDRLLAPASTTSAQSPPTASGTGPSMSRGHVSA